MRCLLFSLVICFANWAAEEPQLFPVLMKESDVFQKDSFKLQRGGLQLEMKNVRMVMIDSAGGMTGAILIGDGTFSFASKTYKMSGQLNAVVLRFNPAEYETITQVDKKERVNDLGVFELGRHIQRAVFQYCWQGNNGRMAILPPKGALSAILYTKGDGNVLISRHEKEVIVWGITADKDLYKGEE